jgi:hypothetical protein
MRLICKTVVVIVVFSSLKSFSFTRSWKLFSSPDGFTVQYPSWWIPINDSPHQLGIRSSRGGAEGVIIKQGQAYINVGQVNSPKSMAQVINNFEKESTELSRRNISADGAPGKCPLIEIVSREPVIPPEDAAAPVPNVINTVYYCGINHHNIVLVLRDWEGDAKQSEYQALALRMAKSIRVGK